MKTVLYSRVSTTDQTLEHQVTQAVISFLSCNGY